MLPAEPRRRARRPARRPRAERAPTHAALTPAARRGRREPSPRARLATLSYTSLSELERCGYRYYLERVLGLPEEARRRALAASARRPRGAGPGHARAPAARVARLRTVRRRRRRRTSARRRARARDALGRAEREEIATLLAAPDWRAPCAGAERAGGAAEQVRREHPFAFSLGADEPLITGVIDLLAREPDGGWLVLDYKSDRVGARGRPGGAGRARLRPPAPALRARRAARRRAGGGGRPLVPGAPAGVGRRPLRRGRTAGSSKSASRSASSAPARARFAVSREPPSRPLRDVSRTGGPVLVERGARRSQSRPGRRERIGLRRPSVPAGP